jgi:predicted SpoU family rRNA methylase
VALRVANKCDVTARAFDPEGASALAVSASYGTGVPALVEAIHARFGLGDFEVDRPRWWTLPQREAIEGWVRREGPARERAG